jgi:hypothetical protein
MALSDRRLRAVPREAGTAGPGPLSQARRVRDRDHEGGGGDPGSVHRPGALDTSRGGDFLGAALLIIITLSPLF